MRQDAPMPDFLSFLPVNVFDFVDSIPSAIQTAFLPENLTGTLLILAAIVVIVAVVFSIVRFILRVCSSLLSVVLMCVGLTILGNIVMTGVSYSASIAGLIENVNIGIASDWIGGIAIVIGIIVAYLTTPKKMRMF